MFIDNYIKTLINTIKDKIYTVGSEPIEGNWDTIENQNKLLYDKISQLNPFIEYDYKVEYHTAWEYYPYPNTRYYPVNILNTDKPCVVLYDSTVDVGFDIILWSPLGGQIKVNFQKDNYRFIGTYFDNYLKLVFMNLYPPSSEPKTVERSYTTNGTFVSETEIDGWVFNTLPVVRWSSYWWYFIEAPITVSLQNYFPSHEHFYEGFYLKKTTLVKTDTGWYAGIGGIGIFMEDAEEIENIIKKIIFLQNPLLMGSSEILGNTLCNNEVWGYTQWGVLRFKC
jgi:hypothetical protein